MNQVFNGASGRPYQAVPLGLADLGLLRGTDDIPGVYILASAGLLGLGRPLYIGKSDDMDYRLRNHERWPEAIALGARWVGVIRIDNAGERAQVEQDLIAAYNPILNTHFRTGPTSFGEGFAALAFPKRD